MPKSDDFKTMQERKWAAPRQVIVIQGHISHIDGLVKPQNAIAFHYAIDSFGHAE